MGLGQLMKPTTTRTLNPLPFQDLEPHRFEDLVRQLAYDLRRWKSLEPIGKSGSDEGMDIRAIELVLAEDNPEENVEEGNSEDAFQAVGERLWIFQCKREKTITPQKIRTIAKEAFGSLAKPPHGFVLAAACDISKKSRDVFREQMLAYGVEEFSIWAKGELEDMLFQPKNDRLLFAYFGLSLTTRRRSLATSLRSEIAKKKQLHALLGDDARMGKLVLLRDPSDERYPRKPKEGEPRAQWMLCRAMHVKRPRSLLVLDREHLAALTPDGEGWDALLDLDVAKSMAENEIRPLAAWGTRKEDPLEEKARAFWDEYIPEQERAFLKIYRYVPLERIVAIDTLGDGYYPVPHVLVEFEGKAGPFERGYLPILEHFGSNAGEVRISPDEANRVAIFPKSLPGELDPPLPGFDNTGHQVVPLSETSEKKLANLFAPTPDKPQSTPEEMDLKESRKDASRAKMKPFHDWRAKIASPTYAAFVTKVRAAGETARVVVRSVDSAGPGHEALESIELRVKVRAGSATNPSYRASGYVRVSLSEYRGWKLEVWPRQDESGRRYPAPGGPAVEGMTQVQLEAEVIGMLERLRSGRL